MKVKQKTTDELCQDYIDSRNNKSNAITLMKIARSGLKKHKNNGKKYKFKESSYTCNIVDVEKLRAAGVYEKYTKTCTRSFFNVTKKRK